MGPEMGTLPIEYGEAMRSVRAAKNLFWWLIAIAVVVQIAVVALVAFGGVLDALPEAYLATSHPASSPAVSPEAQDNACRWKTVFAWALPMTEFLAMVLGVLLVLSLLVSINIALAGRLGGVSLLISAFFWSLLLLAILIPWQRAFQQSPFAGALFDYSDLCAVTRNVRPSWGATGVTVLDKIAYYVRFLAYPVLAVLILLMVELKFRRGCRKMIVSAASSLR